MKEGRTDEEWIDEDSSQRQSSVVVTLTKKKATSSDFILAVMFYLWMLKMMELTQICQN